MHDCWTCSGVHYVGLFGLYVRSDNRQSEVVGPLLSVSPMAKLCKCDQTDSCSCSSETTKFDSGTLTNHIRSLFEFLDIDISNWAVFQTAYNCNVNKAVTRNQKIPHIGCVSHKVNLEVELMIRMDTELKSCIESVYETMIDCRTKLKNRALLRNLTSLSPIVENKTRWPGKYQMLSRFCKIYDELRNAAESEQSTVAMNLTTLFMSNVTRFSAMLGQIDLVTKYLQTEHLSLSDCRLALEKIVEYVSNEKNEEGSELYQCKLGNRYISVILHLLRAKHSKVES